MPLLSGGDCIPAPSSTAEEEDSKRKCEIFEFYFFIFFYRKC